MEINNLELFLILVMVFSLFLSGFFLGYYLMPEKIVYRNPKLVNCREQGLWIRNNTGEWVCVNIQRMSYDRCVEVVMHECGHELFAEKCENNPDLCFELMEKIENANIQKR